MKKKSYYFSLFLIISTFSFSQNLSLSVISSQGRIDNSEDMTLEWILGENNIETINQQNEIYTQGFLQPNISSRLEIQNYLLDFDIIISPNPVNSIFNIYINEKVDSQLLISLYDINGKLIKKISSFNNDTILEINVIELSSGIYVLKVTDTEGSFLETHKIIKY